MRSLNIILITFFICCAVPSYAIIDIVHIRNCSTASACDGVIKVVATGTAGPFTFLWSNGSTESTAYGLCAGSYSVTVTNRIDCSVVLCTYVYACQPSQAGDIVISEKIHLPTGEQHSNGGIDIEASLRSGESSSFYYYWTGPENFVSGSKSISNVPPGIYRLTVTNGCASANKTFTLGTNNATEIAQVISVLPNVPVSIANTPENSIRGKLNIKVYPNPFDGNINIEFGDNNYFEAGGVVITLQNISGEKIYYSKKIEEPVHQFCFSPDTNSMPNGAYVLSILSDNKPRLSYIMIKWDKP